MKQQYNTVTIEHAKNNGYVHITVAYKESEHYMLRNAIKTLQGADFVLVETTEGVEIWRRKTELKLTSDKAA